MRKKGFTLIELLAVIVILAIIAIITVPTILGVIERARKASYKDTVYGIIESARIYLASNQDITKEIEFVCNEEECKRTNGDKLDFRGTVPKSGSIYIKEDGSILVESLYNGRYYANNETGEVVITEDDTTLTRGELTRRLIDAENDIRELKNENNQLKSKNASQDVEINVIKSTTTSIDEVYPVGSIYISTSEINPSNLFKGTEWERYSEGRTLIGEGNGYTAGSTGGSSTATLVIGNLPLHTHGIPVLSGTAASYGNGYSWTYGSSARTVSTWSGAHGHSIYLPVNPNTGSLNSNGYFTSGGGNAYWGGTFTQYVNNETVTVSGQTVADYYINNISGVAAHTHSVKTTASTSGSTGSGTAFSVQNPYVVVYMWKRIA